MTLSSLTSRMNNLLKQNSKQNKSDRVNKALDNTFGKPDSDAFLFVTLTKKEVLKKEKFSKVRWMNKNQFLRELFIG